MILRLLFRFFAVITLLFPAFSIQAQDRPIGYWRSHLPYGSALGVATDGSMLYVITEKGFFTYNTLTGELTPYSKVEGMSDVGMAEIGYDAGTQTVVLGYQNSNMDLFQDFSFRNMPDIRLNSFTGAKTINDIYTDNGTAYISTGLGIVVLNLVKHEVKETYIFTKNSQTIPINAFIADSIYFYAATPNGLYRANRSNPNLQAFATWQAIDTVQNLTDLAVIQHTVYATGTDSLFSVSGDTLKFRYRSGNVTTHIDAGKNALYLSTFSTIIGYGSVRKLDLNLQITDSFKFGFPRQVTELPDNSIWVADAYQGLAKVTDSGHIQFFIPPGPASYTTYGIYAYNNEVWIAHGAFGLLYNPQNNVSGISVFKDQSWLSYNRNTYPLFKDSVSDFIEIMKDPADGTLYAGTLQTGLFVFKADGTGQILKQGILEAKQGEPNAYPATGMVIDQGGNLWVTQLGAKDELAVKTPDGTWYHYTTPFPRNLPHAAAGIIIDDYNQKWYYGPQGGGVIVYNDNNTPDNGNDDTYRQLLQGKGAANLPTNKVYCVAKDRDGSIWIGTDHGIGIINCPTQVIQNECEAELRIVQYDQFAGYLFSTEDVTTIAVDGANRKWIGTNHGIWLISPDADKAIYRFTSDNSPLPSDKIQKIAIDPVTGVVYIGTDQGLISYRSTATEGGISNNNVTTFPNPVPSGYTGTIGIRGLVTDADVRITDISGQLIFRTKALGGQAVWNGLDYTGHRPQSGVYLIFITNKDGTETHVGKMMFLN